MEEIDISRIEDPEERPRAVPEGFVMAPASDCGYAISKGDAWVARSHNSETNPFGDEFMLNPVPGSRDAASADVIIVRACKVYDGVPSALSGVSDSQLGWLRGDYSDLHVLPDALKYYERHEAGIGDDKFAYELRTAINHAKQAIRSRIAPNWHD